MTFLLALAAFIIALHVLNKLNRLEERLEGKLPHLQESPFLSPPPSPSKKEQESSFAQPIPVIAQPESSPSGIDDFFTWIRVDWPLKTGALLIILSFVWLVTYAFLNNWIGPSGRITLGLMFGSAVMVFGNHWFSTSRKQGHVLVALGVSIMLVTIYAAQFSYEMFPSIIALSLTTLVMLFSAVVSIKHNSRALAVISLIIGGLAPILTNAPESGVFDLYIYLLVVCIGVLWLTRYKNWQFLTPLSLVLVSLYSLEYFFLSGYRLEYIRPVELLQLKFFAVTFTTLFFGASLAATLAHEKSKPALGTALLVGMFALGWINGIVQEHNQGLMAMAVAVMFAGGAYAAFTRTQVKETVFVYTAIASVLLAVATAYQFEGSVLTIMFATQAVVLPIFAYRFLTKRLGYSLLLYYLLPIFSSIDAWESFLWSCLNASRGMGNYYNQYTNDYGNNAAECFTQVFHSDFFALLLVTASLLITGYYFYQLHSSGEEKTEAKSPHNAGVILIVIGAVYALALLWRTLTAGMENEDTARMITLIIYTVIALAVYINGQIEKRRVRYWFGFILLFFVIARLLMIEVWNMEIAGRIVTFFLIGGLLMGSVLLRKQIQHPK